MTRAAEWVDGMRGASVLEVAAELGLAVRRHGSGASLYGCPECGAERRHTKTGDKRGAVGLRSDGAGWRCFQCDASGDALALVAHVIGGKPLGELPEHRKAEVREWCARFLGLELGRRDSRNQRIGTPRVQIHPRRVAPAYPPADDVAAVWAAGRPLAEDADAVAWCRGRGASGIDPAAVDALELARVLPPDAPLPSWCGFESKAGPSVGKWCSWPSVGLRLAVPMFDPSGAMRAFALRRIVRPEKPEGGREWPPKSIGAGPRSGLVFACRGALAMLRGERIVDPERISDVWICEGEGDWLMVASRPTRPVAALGIVEGSWSPRLAARIPDGASVIIATDADKQGDAYAAHVMKSLAVRLHENRIGATRWTPSGAPSMKDITDADGPEGGAFEAIEPPSVSELDIIEDAFQRARWEAELGNMEPSQVLDRVAEAVRGKVAGARDHGTPIRDAVGATLAHVRRREAGDVRAVPTPWAALTGILGHGFEPGIHVVTGGTGAGKSTFAVACAIEAAKHGHPTAYVSLELDEVQLGARMLAEIHNRSGAHPVYFSELYQGRVPPQVRLDECGAELAELPIVIDAMDPFGWPASALERIASKAAALDNGKPPFVVLDYLQLVSDEGDAFRPDARTRVGRAAAVAHGVARRTGAAVLILSSVARTFYPIVSGDPSARAFKDAGITFSAEALGSGFRLYGEDALVGLGKESGEIEYTASSVLTLIKSRTGEGDWKGIALAVAKNRFGRTGWLPLRFDGARFRPHETGDAQAMVEGYHPTKDGDGKAKKKAKSGDGSGSSDSGSHDSARFKAEEFG